MIESQANVVASNVLLADVSAELSIWLDVLLAKQPTDKICNDRQRVVLLLDRVNMARTANPSIQWACHLVDRTMKGVVGRSESKGE